MNKVILLTLAGLLVSVQVICAEIYVIYRKSNKEIVFITEKKDYVINDSALGVKILPKNLDFYALDKEHGDYKMVGNNIIINTKKISNRQDKEDAMTAAEEKRAVDRVSAKAKLIGLGLTEDEFLSIIK